MLVNLTIPVFNEEVRLSHSLPKLYRFLTDHCQLNFKVVIADNGSTDRTLQIAASMSQAYAGVRVAHLEEKGRGRVLKKVWIESAADLLTYMDVDLSTGLEAFPNLIGALEGGLFDLAIGSRLLPESRVMRGWKREVISRAYNRLIRAFFGTKFSDAQCGFKAITRQAAQELLPMVQDTGWFFDTELLVLAEKLGYRIREVPVRWVDDPDSRVRIIATAWRDLQGLIRLKRNLMRGAYRCGHGANFSSGIRTPEPPNKRRTEPV
jgi:glycosyltransferase involved in cell wall biosynthesis